ncbi:alpha/beta hydrolase [Paenibacillus thiaminolyticus]|uniref:Alpha/beta hydrolase n=1 Tax=Paenibacillus thiaminolyticus TaxID=49283 RepID=A0AAP9J258_PANTH|nr:alpha/beta fold hydrolase [Paenibacillus thiaminolyticus]MCY9535037.1 alpha/beta hydrolase [Paenibacillus thiaminolyticus]MCY9605168.1 alpha/beta hydrolase [Paenibacillus thiaminolyticus]MCY9606019.1 alpha/beta hydrolase [Paenibacillus thiaminolyticus]MCY9615675.1 alpha/beta hydrolase [Paenibacillus thiaminolyticus]MCY9620422.1 alpha/beta hydrolase [Paenibacillus thiaminolyticus]
MERHVDIRWRDERLAATIHYPGARAPYELGEERRVPVTIICHGFVGSRIGVDRLFVNAARRLAEIGHIVMRFDFAGCGESTGEYGRIGLDDMIEQTGAVLDYALGCGNVDPQRVTIIGHSLGGAVALLTAVRDVRVKRLILWSPVAYPFNDIVRIVGRERYDEAVTRGQSDYLGYSFTQTYFDALGRHQPFQEAPKFNGDVLLVHGTSDDVIPADYSFLYQKIFWMRGDGQCDKEIVFQADHTYSSGEHREKLFDCTLDWLKQWEKRQEEWANWSI